MEHPRSLKQLANHPPHSTRVNWQAGEGAEQERVRREDANREQKVDHEEPAGVTRHCCRPPPNTGRRSLPGGRNGKRTLLSCDVTSRIEIAKSPNTLWVDWQAEGGRGMGRKRTAIDRGEEHAPFRKPNHYGTPTMTVLPTQPTPGGMNTPRAEGHGKPLQSCRPRRAGGRNAPGRRGAARTITKFGRG